MKEALSGFPMWRYSYRTFRAEQVICYSTGRHDYLFIPDENDAVGGTTVHRSGLFDSAEAVYEARIKDEERHIESAQRRIAELRKLIDGPKRRVA